MAIPPKQAATTGMVTSAGQSTQDKEADPAPVGTAVVGDLPNSTLAFGNLPESTEASVKVSGPYVRFEASSEFAGTNYITREGTVLTFVRPPDYPNAVLDIPESEEETLKDMRKAIKNNPMIWEKK